MDKRAPKIHPRSNPSNAGTEQLGFDSVEALAEEARSGAAGQARLMALYIEKAGLTKALATRNWNSFARGYNGPDYRRNRYHTKLATAYTRHRSAAGDAAMAQVLRLGAIGKAVETLQAQIAARGYAITIDGLFGHRTERALRDFQQRNGLVSDGIAGPKTLERLHAEPPAKTNPATRLIASLAGLFRTV